MNPIFTDLEGNKIQINENDRYYKNHRFLFQCRLHRYTSFHIPYKPNTIHFEKDIFYETRILVQRFPNRYKKLKYATLSFSGYLKNDFTFQINAKCHSLYGMKEKSFTFSVKTINNTPELLTTNIPLNGIKDTKLDFSINVKDSNITSLNQETFYITNENIFLENMTYDEDICTIDASIRFHESGTKQTLFRIGDTDNALTDEGKIISNIFDQLPDIIFDSFETENIDIDISNLLTIDNEDTIQVYIDNTNVFTVTTQSTIVTIHNPFIHSGKLYGNFSTTIPIHTLSSKTLVLSIKVNGNIYQESKIEIFSAVNAFRNTSTKFEQIEKFIEYNILKMNIIHKYRDISFLKGNNFNYIDFKYYENTYNTNLELKNYFTALEAKSSFDTGEFAWYNNSREKISDTYSHTANIGDYYKIYLEGKVLYQSKIFTETIETDIFHDLYYHSGFIFNENIHRVVNEYITKPTLTHQLYGDIKNWDVSNVDNFSNLFSNKSITFDLSNWDITKGTNFDNMFSRNTGDSTYKLNFIKNLPTNVNAKNMFESSFVNHDIIDELFNTDKTFDLILEGIEMNEDTLNKIYALRTSSKLSLLGDATEWKTTIQDLKNAGFDARQLYDLGFMNLQEAFSIDEVIDLSVEETKTMYSLKDMLTVYSVDELKIFFTALQIHLAGNIDIPTLIAGGFTDISNFANKAFDTIVLKNQGFTAFKFAEIGYDIKQLRDLGFVNTDFVVFNSSKDIYQNQVFVDEGITVLYGTYTTQGRVNTEVEGVYTLTYNITFDDNEIFSVQKSIHVIDDIPPTATIQIMDSKDIYKESDLVKIKVTFSEPVENVSISMTGSQNVNKINMTKESDTIYSYSHTVNQGKGTCTFEIKANDVSASKHPYNDFSTFEIDTIFPTITINTTSNSKLNKDDSIIVTASFNENVSNVFSNLFFNNNKYEPFSLTQNDKVYEIVFQVPDGNGTATIQVNGTDAAGNESSDSINFEIDNLLNPPQVSINKSIFKENDDLIVSAQFDEAVGNVYFELSGSNNESIQMDEQNDNQFIYTYSIKSGDGPCKLKVYGTDEIGNDTVSGEIIFSIDNTINKPYIELDKSMVQVGEEILVSAQFDEQVENVYFTVNASDPIYMNQSGNNTFISTYTVQENEPSSITVYGTDLVGNTTSNNITFDIFVDLSGNIVDLSGNIVDLSGNIVDLSGNVVDSSGNIY